MRPSLKEGWGKKQSLLCTVFQLYEKVDIIFKEKGILHPRNTAKWRKCGSRVFRDLLWGFLVTPLENTPIHP